MIIANNHHCYIISINILADVKRNLKGKKIIKGRAWKQKRKVKNGGIIRLSNKVRGRGKGRERER